MIELFFVACLQTEPQTCREQSLLFAEEISPFACMMGAQPQLAQWSATHPDWQVAKWSCRNFDPALAKSKT